MSGTCIYCSSRIDRAKEHCLPRGLGNFRGYHFLRNKICNSCNKPISKAEEQFLRASPEAFYRHLFGIKGRKYHKAVSPFYRGSAGAPPIVMKFLHPESNIEILWEVIPGTMTIYELRQIVMSSKGRTIPIALPQEINSSEKLIQHLKKYNLENAEPAYFCTSLEEWDDMLDMIRKIWPQKSWEKLQLRRSKQKVLVPVKITVTSAYFRAVAKVGFHYFLNVFSHQFTGKEAEFGPIRSFILGKGGQPEDFVRQTQVQVVYDFKRGLPPNVWAHILTAKKQGPIIVSRIQFFAGPQYIPPVFEIKIGRNPLKIIYPEHYGHFYSYFPRGPIEGYDGKVVKMKFIKSIWLPK